MVCGAITLPGAAEELLGSDALTRAHLCGVNEIAVVGSTGGGLNLPKRFHIPRGHKIVPTLHL